MRKRFLCFITALCISFVIISSTFISASAAGEAAAVGLSVSVSLFIGMLINDMMGGSGYDFGDACRDLIEVTVDTGEKLGEMVNWENWISGINVIGDGISDTIAPTVDWYNNMIGSCFEGMTPDYVVQTTVQRVNELILSGDITLGVDDNGNLTVLSTDYCTLLDSVYNAFGVDTNYLEDGTMQRTFLVTSIVDSTVYDCYSGWNFSRNVVYEGDIKSSEYVFYAITQDGNIIISDRILKLYNTPAVSVRKFDGTYDNNYGGNTSTGFISLPRTTPAYSYFYCSYDGSEYRLQLGNSSTFVDKSFSYNSVYPNASYIDTFTDSSSYRDVGIMRISSYSSFITAYKNSQLTIHSESVAVSESPTENELKEQGYIVPGVTPGINSKGDVASITLSEDGTKTISNIKTGEADIIENPSDVSDLDFPDSDSIIDKFPFSLPFDLYHLLTIFVVPEQLPIFQIPIKATYEMNGVEVNINEHIPLDFTQFKIGNVDFVQCLVRTSFYILFIAFLIKITPKLIKH